MKKFSLTSLNSCTKRLYKDWLFIGLIMAICVSACSDGDDDATSAPVFPETKSISCNAGETKEFTFDANLDWRLTSSAIWCKFEKDGIDEVTLSGTAGKQTVIIKVSDDDQKVDEASVAKLELAMGDKKAIIAEVTRSAQGYELKIYDAEGNEINQLELGYQTYIPFKVKANFRFAASNFPEWVTLENGSLVGVANKEVEGGLKIVEDKNREKYPIEASDANVITFSDEAGKASYSFPVFYKGMTPGKIDITAPSNNAYGWTVSLDGKTFTQGGSITEGSSITIQDKMPFTITTAEDKYEIVLLETGNDGNIYVMETEDPDQEWMHYERNGGNVNLTIDPLNPLIGKERSGYVLAFTKDEYESIKNNLPDAIIEKDQGKVDIAYKYQQINLMVQFTQKESQEIDGQFFSVKIGTSQESIECALYSGDKIDYYKSEYGVNGVSEMQVPEELPMIATVPFAIESIASYYIEDETNAPNDFATQSLEKEFSISPEKANGKDIFIVVKGASTTDAAILIVKAYKDDGTQKFIVTGGVLAKYEKANAEALKSTYNLSSIYEAKGEDMNIKMTPSAIVTFKVYDLDNSSGNTDVTDDVSGDILWANDPMTGNPKMGTINTYFGEYGSIKARTLLVVVTCEDNTIHGIIVSKGN